MRFHPNMSLEEYENALHGSRVECAHCQMMLWGREAVVGEDGTFFHGDCFGRHEGQKQKQTLATVVRLVYAEEISAEEQRKAA